MQRRNDPVHVGLINRPEKYQLLQVVRKKTMLFARFTRVDGAFFDK